MAEVVLDIQAQINDLKKGLGDTQKQLKDLQGRADQTNKKMRTEVSKTSKVVDNFAAKLAAVFTVGAAIQLTKSIISVRKEFATFQAVLKNTLGSSQAANREFDKIQRFASETPFSVRELTDSFVRLVNQGFKPTTEQMRQLGDLAASTGKDFIQLTEAIIDAQVGEFERLKEFGIRASKQGDIVTFTFKGIETQVDFTAGAIQEYILSLGDLEGVTGAMAEISKTLEGKLSNLKDTWESLLNVLGQRGEGVAFRIIDAIPNFLKGIKTFNEFADAELGARRKASNLLAGFGDDFDVSELKVIERWIGQYASQIIHLEVEISKLEEQGARRKKIERLRDEQEALKQLVQALRAATAVEEQQNEVKKETQERDKNYINNLRQKAELEKFYREQFAVEGVEEVDPIKALEEDNELRLKMLEDEIDAEIDLYKKRSDADIAERRRAMDNDIRLQQEKLDLLNARGQAVVSSLDLIGAMNRENAELQKGIAITQAIINGALAVTKIQSQAGILAPPLIAASILTTLAQIATIRQQKFARGHYEVLGGDRHAQGGVNIGVGEAEQGEGLAVFSRAATQKYGKFLPAFIKAINENDADITGYSDGAYMIHFDDRKQVQKLEDIRKLLSKPEIRYEGKYRIETRNGQTTKIKI